MKRHRSALAIAALGMMLALGCSRDVSTLIASDSELQSQIMGTISCDSTMAGRMIDLLMAREATRAMTVEKVIANGPALQSLMSAVAGDQTLIDGVLDLAVQDSSMRNHVMTLFRGMQMGERR